MNELAVAETLDQQVDGIYARLEKIARENLAEALSSPHYTGPQKVAMIQFKMLEEASGLDLPPLLVKGRILDDIHRMSLWTQLPGEFQSEEEAVEAVGKLSRSEQSNIKDLHGVIFPFVKKYLSMSEAEFWMAARNKSNIREVVPYMKAVITGELSNRDSVNEAVQRLQESAGSDKADIVVEHIIELASAETNKSLRQYLRPVVPIQAALLRRNGTSYFIAEVDTDDTQRLLSSTMFVIDHVNLEEYTPQQVPMVRRLMGG